MNFWQDYQSHIGEECEVCTARTHYRGVVTDFHFFGETYEVKITRTFRGKLHPGDHLRVPPDVLQPPAGDGSRPHQP